MLKRGDVLGGRYTIEKPLGAGGMGGVYLAMHETLQARVAVKEMTIQSDTTEEHQGLVEQFRTEARILNGLRHPNLPQVHDFFEVEGHQYLVMDFNIDRAPALKRTSMPWAPPCIPS
jgi:serine/threonine-protein kinase